MDDGDGFGDGLKAGAAVMAGELVFYILDKLVITVEASPINISQTASLFQTYSIITLFALGAGFTFGIWVGYSEPGVYCLGYFLGDIFMVVILWAALQSVAPPVLTGMIIALIPVLVGIIINKYISKNNHQNNYGW